MKDGEDVALTLIALLVVGGLIYYFIKQKQAQELALQQAQMTAAGSSTSNATNTADQLAGIGCVAGAVGSGAGALAPLCGYVGKGIVYGTQGISYAFGGSKGKEGPIESTTSFYAGGATSIGGSIPHPTSALNPSAGVGIGGTTNFIEGGVENVGVTSLANRVDDTSFMQKHNTLRDSSSVALLFATGGLSLISSQQRHDVAQALEFWNWNW